MSRITPLAVLLVAAPIASALAGCAGCQGSDRDAERRAAEEATAAAEGIASETTVTQAILEAKDETKTTPEQGERARGEIVAAFQLEQADHRGRLQKALDTLDKEVAHARQRGGPRAEARLRDLRDRRLLLKADLDAVNRSTEQDWATLRTKVDRDLGSVPRAAAPR